MQGPIAARMSEGRLPNSRVMAATALAAECAGHGVEQQDRRAVRAEAAERHARLIGDEAVADDGLLAGKTCAAVGSADAEDGIRVLLLREDGLLRREAGGGAEDAVILTHVFRHVAPVRAEVERGKMALAHAAEARGKAVDGAGEAVGSQIF